MRELVVLVAFLVGLDLSAQDASLAELAATDAWHVVEARAGERLAAGADDPEAHYWIARAQVRQLDGLGTGGMAEQLRARILRQVDEHLVAACDAPSPVRGAACEWLGLVAWTYGVPGSDVEERLVDAWEREGNGGAAYALGLLAADAGDSDAAHGWLQRAADAAPERGDVLLAWADVLSARGARDEAVSAWLRASEGRFDAVVGRDALLDVSARILPGPAAAGRRLQCLDTLLERPEWKDDALLAWHRAFALEELGRIPEALAAFDAGTRGRTPLIERAHARAASLNDRPEQAVQILRPLAEQRDWTAYADLVSVADRLGSRRRFAEAVEIYDLALDIEPRHERALHNRAITLWRAGDVRAAAAFDALCEQFPRRADLLNDAALAALARGDTTRARAALQEAAAFSDAVDAQENLAQLELSEGSLDARRRATVEALLEGVLAADPGRARALVLRARLAMAPSGL